MRRLCVLNVVGLTPSLLRHAPHIAALGDTRPWRSPIPAVTSTCQATLLSGLAPAQHDVVANGWCTAEVVLVVQAEFYQRALRDSETALRIG